MQMHISSVSKYPPNETSATPQTQDVLERFVNDVAWSTSKTLHNPKVSTWILNLQTRIQVSHHELQIAMLTVKIWAAWSENTRLCQTAATPRHLVSSSILSSTTFSNYQLLSECKLQFSHHWRRGQKWNRPEEPIFRLREMKIAEIHLQTFSCYLSVHLPDDSTVARCAGMPLLHEVDLNFLSIFFISMDPNIEVIATTGIYFLAKHCRAHPVDFQVHPWSNYTTKIRVKSWSAFAATSCLNVFKAPRIIGMWGFRFIILTGRNLRSKELLHQSCTDCGTLWLAWALCKSCPTLDSKIWFSERRPTLVEDQDEPVWFCMRRKHFQKH